LTVRHGAASAGQVRRQLVADLIRRGLSGDVVQDAALLMTELVTNAVRYANPLPGDVLRVAWELTGGRLLLKVTDGGGREAPHRQDAGPRDTGGRGLAIVDRVAARWGVERAVDNLSTVWAEVPLRVSGNGSAGNGSGRRG
jgi:anti-sigma regulatory factor (Ser/Thr protein kinase)